MKTHFLITIIYAVGQLYGSIMATKKVNIGRARAGYNLWLWYQSIQALGGSDFYVFTFLRNGRVVRSLILGLPPIMGITLVFRETPGGSL